MKKLFANLFFYCIFSGALAQNPNYLIICPDSLHDCAETLKEYREDTGYNVSIVDLSSIINDEQLSNEIIDAWIEDYIAVNKDLKYIVLLGNIDKIPTFISNYPENGNFDSDLWYSVTNDSLSTNYIPTLSIGRIPIGNTHEFTNYFNKIKKFESNLTSSKTILFFGYEAEMSYAINRDIQIAEDSGFTTISLILPDETTLLNTLSNESLFAVIYYGHGSVYGDYNINKTNLINWENIEKPVLYFSGSCDFNNNTIDEIPFGDALAISPNGSVCSIGASLNGGYGYDYSFIEGLLQNIKYHSSIGDLYNTSLNYQLNSSLDDSISSWSYYFTRRMNFIGDPGIIINSNLMDDDVDGVLNNVDQCPDTPTGEEVNSEGCSESQLDGDNDGVMNDVDNCPDTLLGVSVDVNGCSESQKDDDQDGVMNNIDNCPDYANEDQNDFDEDGIGDACDDDIDGDGIMNDVDNCSEKANEDQSDMDGDGIGDACDDDMDGDGVLNDVDNCPEAANVGQEDLDNDGIGDICDDDIDGDEVLNDVDNCPEIANSGQHDFDGDVIGDTCDDDLDGDGVNNENDNSPETPNPDQSDIDNDGIGDVSDDDVDGDAVLNEFDNCPSTPIGQTVDANGCSILAADIFDIEVVSETCPDKNNGEILIVANENMDYKLTLNGVDSGSFTTTKTISNLVPGTYEFCIVVYGKTSPYCYSIEIEEGVEVSAKSETTKNKTVVQMQEGTAPYYVFVNGEKQFETMSKTFDLSTKHGDYIEVLSSKNCEGIYTKAVDIIDQVVAFPNPTKGLFDIAIPFELNDVTVEIFNNNSQLISRYNYMVINNKIQVDLSNYANGVYEVKLMLNKPISLRIIKE